MGMATMLCVSPSDRTGSPGCIGWRADSTASCYATISAASTGLIFNCADGCICAAL